jgi:hypothetical protein
MSRRWPSRGPRRMPVLRALGWSAILGCFGEEIGLAENTIQTHLLLSRGRMAYPFVRFHVHQGQDLVVLSTTDMESRQRRYLQQNRELSATSGTIHF